MSGMLIILTFVCFFYLPFYVLHMQALYSENVTVYCLNPSLHLRNVDVKPRV